MADRKPDINQLQGAAAKEEGSDQRIRIKLKAQDGNETIFQLKPTTKFQKVMENYAQRLGVPQSSFKLMWEGTRISESDTPDSLGLENDDIIDVFVEQQGGSA